MGGGKMIGKIYDGRWKVMNCKDNAYILENIYNHRTIKIYSSSMIRIDKGETTVSQIITNRAARAGKKAGSSPFIGRTKAERRRAYAIKQKNGD